jgi:hypothetical protein
MSFDISVFPPRNVKVVVWAKNREFAQVQKRQFFDIAGKPLAPQMFVRAGRGDVWGYSSRPDGNE